MLDASMIASGVVTEKIIEKTKNEPAIPLETLLMEIRDTLELIHRKLCEVEKADVYKIILLQKLVNINISINDFKYIRVLVPTSTVLSVYVAGLGTFPVTIGSGVWVDITFAPEFLLSLDNSNQTNTANVMLKYTNNDENN